MKALILLVVSLVALCSCSSPLELDTPRDKTYDSIPDPGTQHTAGTPGRTRQQAITAPPHAVGKQVVVTFSNDNAATIENYDCVWTLKEIDTSGPFCTQCGEANGT